MSLLAFNEQFIRPLQPGPTKWGPSKATMLRILAPADSVTQSPATEAMLVGETTKLQQGIRVGDASSSSSSSRSADTPAPSASGSGYRLNMRAAGAPVPNVWMSKLKPLHQDEARPVGPSANSSAMTKTSSGTTSPSSDTPATTTQQQPKGDRFVHGLDTTVSGLGLSVTGPDAQRPTESRARAVLDQDVLRALREMVHDEQDQAAAQTTDRRREAEEEGQTLPSVSARPSFDAQRRAGAQVEADAEERERSRRRRARYDNESERAREREHDQDRGRVEQRDEEMEMAEEEGEENVEMVLRRALLRAKKQADQELYDLFKATTHLPPNPAEAASIPSLSSEAVAAAAATLPPSSTTTDANDQSSSAAAAESTTARRRQTRAGNGLPAVNPGWHVPESGLQNLFPAPPTAAPSFDAASVTLEEWREQRQQQQVTQASEDAVMADDSPNTTTPTTTTTVSAGAGVGSDAVLQPSRRAANARAQLPPDLRAQGSTTGIATTTAEGAAGGSAQIPLRDIEGYTPLHSFPGGRIPEALKPRLRERLGLQPIDAVLNNVIRECCKGWIFTVTLLLRGYVDMLRGGRRPCDGYEVLTRVTYRVLAKAAICQRQGQTTRGVRRPLPSSTCSTTRTTAAAAATASQTRPAATFTDHRSRRCDALQTTCPRATRERHARQRWCVSDDAQHTCVDIHAGSSHASPTTSNGSDTGNRQGR